MKKYIIFDSAEEFDSKNLEFNTLFNLSESNPKTKSYCSSSENYVIDNPEHADNGKFYFPVLTYGSYKTDQFFQSSELVDFDSDWLVEPELLD